MLDSILNSLKGELADQIGSKFDLPTNKVDDAASLAKDSILDNFKSEISGGNISNILGLFNGKQSIASSPLVGNIISNYASKIGSQLGLSPSVSSAVAKFAIPFILNQINDKTPEDGVSENGLMDIVGDSIMDGIKGKLGGLFGKF